MSFFPSKKHLSLYCRIHLKIQSILTTFVTLRNHFKDLPRSKNSHEGTDTFSQLTSRRMGTPFHSQVRMACEAKGLFPPLFQSKAFPPCFSLCLLVPLLSRPLLVSFMISSSNQESSFYPVFPPISLPTSTLPILTPFLPINQLSRYS